MNAILSGLDRDPPRYTQPARRMFYSVVLELGGKPIALIDDAQEMKDAALLSLKSLATFSSGSQTRITFILSGQPELRGRLKLAQYHALRQRIHLFYHMKPMALEETCRYIDYLTKATGNPTPLFFDAAKADIHRHADGIPRVVNTICYRSIINTAVRNLKIVDSVDVFLEDPAEPS